MAADQEQQLGRQLPMRLALFAPFESEATWLPASRKLTSGARPAMAIGSKKR